MSLFPITGEIDPNSQVYCCFFGASNNGDIQLNNVYYLTVDTSNTLWGSLPDSGTGTGPDNPPTFNGGDNKLLIFTYLRKDNSTAEFSTTTLGETKYLTEKGNHITTLGNDGTGYPTQGLQDLWSGNFDLFIWGTGQNENMRFNVLIQEIPSRYITFIPTTIYDDNCTAIDNSKGGFMAPLIANFEKKGDTDTIYYASKTSCSTGFKVAYCQNRDKLNTGKCGKCMSYCSNYDKSSSSPVCNVNLESSSYLCSAPVTGEGSSGEGGKGGKKSMSNDFFSSIWFYVILGVAGAIIVLMVIIVFVKLAKRKT